VTVGVLVPAAGQGVRLGPGVPKALRLLAGEPLLVHAVRGLREAREVGEVVVAAPPDEVAQTTDLLGSYDVDVVAGGATRSASVSLALQALAPGVELVLVHDAARCLTPPAVVSAVVAALRDGAEAVVPVLPVADTVKRVRDDRVLETVARADLRAAQTPQGFRRAVLVMAHERGGDLHTDDAGMVEAAGGSVWTVPGHVEAFKVTTPLDLLLAEAVLRERV
jgi:2-C-methyl-D-erythritol 4-phosphate cytidylyltransferase